MQVIACVPLSLEALPLRFHFARACHGLIFYFTNSERSAEKIRDLEVQALGNQTVVLQTTTSELLQHARSNHPEALDMIREDHDQFVSELGTMHLRVYEEMFANLLSKGKALDEITLNRWLKLAEDLVDLSYRPTDRPSLVDTMDLLLLLYTHGSTMNASNQIQPLLARVMERILKHLESPDRARYVEMQDALITLQLRWHAISPTELTFLDRLHIVRIREADHPLGWQLADGILKRLEHLLTRDVVHSSVDANWAMAILYEIQRLTAR